jgi:putative heme iron utilization protein
MPQEQSDGVFTPAVVDAILTHLNEDHASEALLICQTLGFQPLATSATAVALDDLGIDFLVDGPTGEADVRIPWDDRLVDREQVRAEVVRLTAEARRMSGLPADG